MGCGMNAKNPCFCQKRQKQGLIVLSLILWRWSQKRLLVLLTSECTSCQPLRQRPCKKLIPSDLRGCKLERLQMQRRL